MPVGWLVAVEACVRVVATRCAGRRRGFALEAVVPVVAGVPVAGADDVAALETDAPAARPNFITPASASTAPTSGAAPLNASLKFAMRTAWSKPALPAASAYC